MPRMPAHTWTDEMVADLTQMVSESKKSCSLIAMELNSKYDVELTRNAVIGKCTRLGLSNKPVKTARGRGKKKALKSIWTELNIARLEQFRLDGLTAVEIAAQMNKQFGIELNRNQVLGKLNYLGLKSLSGKGPTKRPIKRPPKGGKSPADGNFGRPRKTKKAPFEAMVPTVVTDVPEPVLAGTPEPLPGKCRYPRGENPHYDFCGAPRGKGRASYCEFHHKLCNVPGMTWKEARAKRQRRRAA